MATVTTSIGTALGSAGDGVVTLTSGSTSVTGQGTFFTTSFTGGTAPPQAIEIPIGGGTYYTVKSVESNTELTLVSDPGVSASMQSWKVGTRDYSTIATWAADLDNTAIYSSGDIAKGECYDDSDFTETTSLIFDDGGTVQLDKMLLTVPVGQRHDGTAGSGAQVNFAAGASWKMFYGPGAGFPMERTVEWLDLNGAGNSHTATSALELCVGGATTYYGQANHLLIHDFNHTGGHNWEAIDINSTYSCVHNCIIYDCQGAYNCIGLWCHKTSCVAVNNTVYKMKSTQTGSSDNKGIGIWFSELPVANKNNIAMGSEAVVTQADFYSNVGTYNLSSDATATGSNSVASQATANIFISTTNGSEDLHILRSSNAVGAAEDLGTGVTMGSITAGSSTYGTPLNRDINNGDRNSRAMAWDIGASQNAIVSTIGTTGREYSTVAAWTADLDEDTYYGAGSVARGECYADTAFTACQLENGDTIGLTRAVLTAADGQQHDGTAGTGVVFNMAGVVRRVGGVFSILSFLEFTQSSTYANHDAVNARNPGRMQVSHCLIHGYDLRQANSGQIALLRQSGGSNGASESCHNNILYDLTRGIVGNKTQTLYGIKYDKAYAATTNNTVYNIHADSTDGTYTQNAVGIYYERINSRVKNNIAMGLSSANGTTTGMACEDGSPTHANNNMVNDTSAGAGTSSQTGKSSSGQFVSTTTGSEDLHLVTGSDAIGNGEDLGLFTDATGFAPYPGNYVGLSWYVWGQNYDINRGNRHAFSQTWDIGASQYAIISTIGTNSRDYSTFTAWEADLDDTSYYGEGSVANGQMYKDSDYQWNGTFYLDGGATLKLRATYLTVAEGQRHDGTPNTGVRFLNNGSAQYHCMVVQLHYGSNPVVRSLEWVEMDENAKGGGGCTHAFNHYAGGWGQSSIGSFNHCMIYNYYMGNISAGDKAGVIAFGSQYGQAHHNLLFNIKAGNPSGSQPFLGNLFGITSNRTCVVTNNTIYGLKHVDGTSGEAMGLKDNAYTTQEIYNNICVGNETQDFHDWDGATHSHNLSSDSSATGTGAVTGKSAASLFVSTTVGSEDLHLIDGAGALRVGKDLGTKVTFGGVNYGGEGTCLTHVNIDIDGRNRDSEGDDWDIGADQCEDCSEGGAVTNTAFMFFVD